MSDMPKVLGVGLETVVDDDSCCLFAKTSVGEVIIYETDDGFAAEWAPPRSAAGAIVTRIAKSEAEAAKRADSFLRALLTAAVEPAAKRLEDGAMRTAANVVRDFYKEEA